MKEKAQIKEKIKERYGQVAVGDSSSCCDPGGCCSNSGVDPTISVIVPLKSHLRVVYRRKRESGRKEDY